jgi:hypothetical protein
MNMTTQTAMAETLQQDLCFRDGSELSENVFIPALENKIFTLGDALTTEQKEHFCSTGVIIFRNFISRETAREYIRV